MNKKDFYFDLPEALIAQYPIADRASSRLMIINKDTGASSHGVFTDIIDLINPGDCLVINDTKVIPARLIGQIEGLNARMEFLLIGARRGDCWEVMVKPGKKARVGTKVSFGEGKLRAEVLEITDSGNRIVRFECSEQFSSFAEALKETGEMPLPPYIKAKQADTGRYQTVYAAHEGSAAAPTAGLHFTDGLLGALSDKGVEIAKITLHIGPGTFQPVKVDDIEQHKMHPEIYNIDAEQAEKINSVKRRGGKIIAVGTTSCRTLEACADGNGFVRHGSGSTDIFIFPGYKFKIVDRLITNFHLPESTLIMLVSALCGRENILAAYNEAVALGYRFFSFGDAMFII